MIPFNERTKITAAFHDMGTAGHMDLEETLERIRDYFYWDQMYKTVSQYVTSCVTCKACNIRRTAAPGELVLLLANHDLGDATFAINTSVNSHTGSCHTL